MQKTQIETPKKSGFTLIEILVVIGLIAILATIVIIAINPARQFSQARNTQRTSNVNAILNAIGQRIADNKGTFEGTFGTYTCGPLPTAATAIDMTTMAANVTTPTGALACLVPTYISSALADPETGAAAYTVIKDATSGRVTVAAPGAELSVAISIMR
jgi:type IV pilus assembly protein PilA